MARPILHIAALAMLSACAAGGNRQAPGGAGVHPGESAGTPPAARGQDVEAESETGEDGAAKEELRRLRARAAELEATLDTMKRASGPPDGTAPVPPADTKTLLAITGRMDGPALHAEVEKLLLGGEEGFAALHDFFHQADIDHDKIDAITHNSQLICSMLRLVALHPDEVARFSSYLMKATRDRPKSWLRREYFNFLPVFLLHHPGRYPELRRDLEEDILYQIEQGGAFLYKVALAMRDLDFKPPAEVFLPILADPGKRESHSIVIEQLTARKEEGLEVLRRYLSETRDFKSPTVGAALRAVARLEGREGGTVEKLLEHEDVDFRGAALFAYFGEPRDETDLPRVIEFLDSKEVSIPQKQRFLSLLAQKNVGLFDILFAGAETSIADEQVKEALRRTAAAVARRKAREQAAASKKAPGPGDAALETPPE